MHYSSTHYSAEGSTDAHTHAHAHAPLCDNTSGAVVRCLLSELCTREPYKSVRNDLPNRIWASHYVEIEPLQKCVRNLQSETHSAVLCRAGYMVCIRLDEV